MKGLEKQMLSVIIPSYNEDAMIEKTAAVISGLLAENNIDCEIIFVDDGSKDNTWKLIQDTASNNPLVHGIHFSRNFGKESAIVAGLTEAKGDAAVVIDCDLQHPPETIPEMYRLWEEGYEVIEGQKRSRGQESAAHGFAAKTFYSLMSSATGIDMSKASDFKLLDRKAIDVLINLRERNSFFRALSSWIGFKTAVVEYDVREREAGETKWSTKSLVKYAVNNITGFTAAPMHAIAVLGCILLTVSLIFGVVTLIQKINGKAVEGFTTVILLLGFSSSIIITSLGIIGYYIEKIYDEIKGRPKYIVSEKC